MFKKFNKISTETISTSMIRRKVMSGERIIIFDTTLRDGEQSPGFSMNIEEKLLFAEQLEKLRR